MSHYGPLLGASTLTGDPAEIRTSNTQQGIAKEEVSPPLDTGPSAFAVQSSKGVGAATPCGRRSESGVARDTACRTHSKTAGTGETLNAQRPTPNAQGENTGETPASRGGRCNWEVLEERLRDVLRTEHYAYTTEQTYVGWSFSVHSVISSRTANYAIRTVSGVGGAPRKGRPYPDLCLHIRLIRHSCREIEFPRGLVFRAGHSLRIEII